MHYPTIQRFCFKKGTTLSACSPSIACVLVLANLLLGSCNVGKYLKTDEHYVSKNQIDLPNSPNYDKSTLSLELATLYRQKAIGTFLTNGRIDAWLYLRHRDEPMYRPTGLAAWQYKKAKIPPFFNDTITTATARSMAAYLQNKGFLYAKVGYDKYFNHKTAEVTYHVQTGMLYVFDSVTFTCKDTAIQLLLRDYSERTFLVRGTAVDLKSYELEKVRITALLNSHGYAKFNALFIALESDTNNLASNPFTFENGRAIKRKVNATLSVLMPSQGKHDLFKNGEVRVYPVYNPNYDYNVSGFNDTLIQNKRFITEDHRLGVRGSVLVKALAINQDSFYSTENIDQTYRKINNLGLYKFSTIKPLLDDCDSNIVNYNVFLTPHKRMNFDAGVAGSYSRVATTTNPDRFGFSGDIAFMHRNLFGGAERLTTNINASYDFNFGLDYRLEANLQVPRLLNLSRSLLLYRNIGILRNDFYKKLKNIGVTNFSSSYSYTSRIGSFNISALDLNYGFEVKNTENTRYSFTQSGVRVYTSNIEDSFRVKILDNNQRLARSLESNFLTGFVFRNLNFTWIKPTDKRGNRWYLNAAAEQSGSEIWLFEQITQPVTPYTLNGYNLSKFGKLEAELRYSHTFTRNRELAFRFFGGVANAFGNSGEVPFAKQFFVGGPNSIRGWRAFGLGPGGYRDPTVDSNVVQYQTGNVRLEANVEYRFPVWGVFESAVFVDAGNVWALKEDLTRPKSNFSGDFLNQMAIGTGFSFRINIKYALLRFDFGYKLRNPYATEGSHFALPRWRNFEWQYLYDDMNFNLAFGTPF